MPLDAGTRFGPYEIRAPVGAGGMGEVYRAHDPRLDRDVALKVLPEGLARDAERLRRFEKEARAAGGLNHPNVVAIHDVGRSETGLPFLVSELLEGETLRERLGRGGLSVHKALEYARQIADGLAAAHARGILHRDLKPENLFLTRDGRVKILDFGLAKHLDPSLPAPSDLETGASTSSDTLVGTAPYMSPEQVRRARVDARSDIFSLGVVLYEMLAGRRPFGGDTAVETMTAILRQDPLPLSPLNPEVPPGVERLVSRCLQKPPEERFQSCRDLALALETLSAAPAASWRRAEGEDAEEPCPYPGLAAFGEADAERFFGREEYVSRVWSRLRGRPLVALVGPSGAGKTSFVRAGVVAARPSGWAAVVATPGSSPIRMLGQALAPELAGDPEALRKLVRFDEPDTAFEVVSRWRRGHAQALLVVDQLEELFTLNDAASQAAFARLLGRLASEADVHVLVSLRDDFLMSCGEHEGLRDVFEELVPLLPLSREGLRRALVEPAERAGYAFEDASLVETMLEAVEGERAALPLLAFAVAQLWGERDRERRRLTHEGYAAVGGVAGALAQHAESVLERIGSAGQAVVRELFRNLVTAQGTRAVREREELLSVLPDREAAERVLGRLVEARLLTAFEVEGGDGEPHRRIEVVHESLLEAWPRLVRWRAQDEDGARLRDDLRQAARRWDEHGRPDDLLWTGSAYRELQLWRERDPGGLARTEQAFATATVAHAGRVRRRRRTAVTALVAILVGGLATVGTFWRSAVAESERAEAGKLLALGQVELDRHPTAAVAYATKSLELADTPEARRFALRALQRGPTARVLTVLGETENTSTLYAHGLVFRPDGSWLAIRGNSGVQVWPSDGGDPLVLDGYPWDGGTVWPCFSPAGDVLATVHHRVDLWGFPGGELLSRRELDGARGCGVHGGRLVTGMRDGDEVLAQSWPFDGGDPGPVRRLMSPVWDAMDPRGRLFAWLEGRDVHVRRLDNPAAPAWRVGSHDHATRVVKWDPAGERLAVRDESGEIRIWSAVRGAGEPLRTLPGEGTSWAYDFDASGSRLAAAAPGDGPRTQLWDLEGPPDAEPLELHRVIDGSIEYFHHLAFDPTGQWLATAHVLDVAFWPLARTYPRVLRQEAVPYGVAFTPDGEFLLTTERRYLRRWPLSPGVGNEADALVTARGGLLDLTVSGREDRYLAAGEGGGVYTGRLAGGELRELDGFDRATGIKAVAFDATGRLAAAAPHRGVASEKVIRVWDLETGDVRVLGPIEGARDGYAGACGGLHFTPDGQILASADGLRLWNLGDGSFDVLDSGITGGAALSPDGRRVVYSRRRDPVGGYQNSPPAGTTWITDLVVLDMTTRESRALFATAFNIGSVALDPDGERWVAGLETGDVLVGPVTGESAPHLLLGHESLVTGLAVSPDGRWIASSGDDNTIRLWPMPEGLPLHTLPYEELLEKLHALTNLRVVENDLAPGGYDLQVGPFPGWAEVPTW